MQKMDMQIGRVGNETSMTVMAKMMRVGLTAGAQVSRDLARRLNTPCSLLR
jgi:hypothetical protein